MKPTLVMLCAGTCWLATVAAAGPSVANVRAWGLAATRPFVLPFLWRSLDQAVKSGDPGEAFAKAQLLLTTLPDWIDGHVVFAWRYAFDGGSPLLQGAARAEAAKARLQAALAMLEAVRAQNPTKSADVLVWMAFLVELAAQQQPGLAELLTADPGFGEPVRLADRYLEQAERSGGRAQVREQRIFMVPQLCASMLRAGERASALQLLDATIARCGDVRDRELGQQWQATLQLLRRCLAGEPVDPAPLLDDQRLRPLQPFLQR